VTERETEREIDRKKDHKYVDAWVCALGGSENFLRFGLSMISSLTILSDLYVCMCVCVCLYERERPREKSEMCWCVGVWVQGRLFRGGCVICVTLKIFFSYSVCALERVREYARER